MELLNISNSLCKFEQHYSTFIPIQSEKINVLVNALRLVSNDSEIKFRNLVIADNCEKYGFIEGNHNLGTLLHFLADMLEE